MNRLYTIMLLVMLVACGNDTSDDTSSVISEEPTSQGGDKEKVYSLDGHPLAPYRDDPHIITFSFPVSITNYTTSREPLVSFSMPLYIAQECTTAGLPLFCETPRRQYIDDAKADGFSGELLDVVIEEYDEKCAAEKIEENCQREIDTALSRLEKIGRTDITEAHLRNPAFWRLQEQAFARFRELRELGGSYSDISTDALDRLKKFEAGSY